MATKTTAPAAAEDETATTAGGRRKKALLLAPVLVVLLAGWYLVLGPGGGGSGAAEEHAEPELGEVVALDPITMNLADGRLLKVGLALQLPLEPKSDHEVNGSVALDEAISFLGGHSYEQLAPPAARQEAKQELSHRVAERYHDEVLQVYFTEFVMQ